MELGKSGLMVSRVGIGAWSWGDRSGYWGYGQEYGKDAAEESYKACLDLGLNFIDTAEVCPGVAPQSVRMDGSGLSEGGLQEKKINLMA